MKEEIRIGDWVVALKDLSGTGECIKGSLYKVKELGMDYKTISVFDEWVKDGYEYAGWTGIENFRKATTQEIYNHFSTIGEIIPGDWVVATEQAVKSGHAAGIWLVEEVTTGSELSNSHLLLTSNGYSQKSYFRKATPDEISAHLAKKEEVKPEWELKPGDPVQYKSFDLDALGYYVGVGRKGAYIVENKTLSFAREIKPAPMKKVSIIELTQLYAEKHNLLPEQIQIV